MAKPEGRKGENIKELSKDVLNAARATEKVMVKTINNERCWVPVHALSEGEIIAAAKAVGITDFVELKKNLDAGNFVLMENIVAAAISTPKQKWTAQEVREAFTFGEFIKLGAKAFELSGIGTEQPRPIVKAVIPPTEERRTATPPPAPVVTVPSKETPLPRKIPTAKTCWLCMSEIPEGSTFCPNCGAVIEAEEEKTEAPEQRPSKVVQPDLVSNEAVSSGVQPQGKKVSRISILLQEIYNPVERTIEQLGLNKVSPFFRSIQQVFERLGYTRIILLLFLIHAFLILWTVPNYYLNVVDDAYHTMIGRFIIENGFAGWENLEFAPLGRPHLYPPLLHVLIGALGKILGGTGDAYVLADSVVSAFTFLLGILAAWLVGKTYYGPRGGFIAFVIASGSQVTSVFLAFGLPTGLLIVLLLLGLWAFAEKKYILSTGIFTAALYSHISGIALALISLLITGYLLHRLRKALLIYLSSLVLFSPWLIRLIVNLSWFSTRGMVEDVSPWWDYVLLAMAIPGLLFCLQGIRDKASRERNAVALGYFAAFIPSLFTYFGRFSTVSALSQVLLATVFIQKVISWIPKHRRLVLATVFIIMYGSISYGSIFKASMLQTELYFAQGPAYERMINWDKAKRVGEILATNFPPNTIVHFQNPYFGCAVAVYAPIRLDTGVWKEATGHFKNTFYGIQRYSDGTPVGVEDKVFVLKLGREKPRILERAEEIGFVHVYGTVDEYTVLKIQPLKDAYKLRGEILRSIASEAQIARKIFTSDYYAAGEHISNIELCFYELAYIERNANPDIASELQIQANRFGVSVMLLTEKWAQDMGYVSQQYIDYMKIKLLKISESAESENLSGLLYTYDPTASV